MEGKYKAPENSFFYPKLEGKFSMDKMKYKKDKKKGNHSMKDCLEMNHIY